MATETRRTAAFLGTVGRVDTHFTLPSGSETGQLVRINTPLALTIDTANVADATTISLATDGYIELVWYDVAWFVIHQKRNVTIT